MYKDSDLKKEDELIYRWKSMNNTLALKELVDMIMKRNKRAYDRLAKL